MGIARTSLKGVTYYDSSKAYNGYTLFAPTGGKNVWLIDMQGNVVNRWNTPHGASPTRFLPNGNLLYASGGGGRIMGPGTAYIIGEEMEESIDEGAPVKSLVETDWDGGLVWKCEAPQFSHDLYRMENGNTMYIKYIIVPDDIKDKVKGGIPGTEANGIMWADGLEEITPEGKVVWEWLAYEHLDPEIDIICPLAYRGEWTHMNNCTVLKNGDILGSFRQTNIICIIDKATGSVKWRWGSKELGHQHEPTMLDNGNILVFDNGVHRPLSQDLDYYSRVIEVNPATNKIEWEYKDNPLSEFYSIVMGSAQRLPNGNTLICEAVHGRIFEVTHGGEIVWEYATPFYGSLWVYGECNVLYRAYRYGTDYEGLKGKDLDPDNFKWINRIYGSTLLQENKRISLYRKENN